MTTFHFGQRGSPRLSRRAPRTSSAHGCPCPICGSPSEVTDSRKDENSDIRRRRRCTSDPSHRFTTLESISNFDSKHHAKVLNSLLDHLNAISLLAKELKE